MPLLLITATARHDGSGPVPLQRSLAEQSDGRWTTDSSHPRVTATALLDDDSVLRPDAVGSLLDAFDDPTVDVLFADALIDGDRALRPAWSPTRLRVSLGEVDLVAARGRRTDASLAARVRTLHGVADHMIGHLPAPLIERTGPVPLDTEAEAALAACAARRDALATPTSTSFVIPTAGTRHADGRRMADGAIDAARRSFDGDIEILLIVGQEFDGDPSELEADGVRVVDRPFPFNFSAAINVGLLAARNDTVVLLNDDIEAPVDGWLEPMLALLRDPNVGLVGSTLLYPDGTIQHHGVVIDDAFPLHPYVGQRPADLEPAALAAHEVVAVTGACVLGRRADFLEIGGLHEPLPASFNDVDMCLKMHRSGRRVVLQPATQLTHFESATRETRIHPWEWDGFVGRWGGIDDPWYHPGFHRPDQPHDRRRNADHLPTALPHASWPLRTITIHPRPHQSRLQPEAAPEPQE